jgi:RNA polymerase sigma-70 factor (ECF subfamily)
VQRDEELVARSKHGDIDAFEELVCLYERKVFTVTYRLMGNREDASDLAQETFLRAFQSLNGFRGEASFLTWICRIATNVCRDELRKRCRIAADSLDEKITLDDGEVTRQFASTDPGPDEIYEKKELQARIQGFINTLSPEFRLALVLRDIIGYSYEEIARQLECSPGTVKSRISRARNYLKEKLLAEREQNNRRERLYG